MDNRTIEEIRENETKLIKELKKIEKRLEQLENIRKEAIEVINQYIPNYASCVKAFDELENILNKGDNKE